MRWLITRYTATEISLMSERAAHHAFFVFESSSGKEVVPPHSLLVCIDETGEESLSDPEYPLFGLGGCAALATDYAVNIVEPWMALKAEHFGDARFPLHARDFGSWSESQVGAIGTFFTTRHFARIGSLTTSETVLAPGVEVFNATATGLLMQLLGITPSFRMTGISFVFESSTRGDRLAERFFSHVKLNAKQDGVSIPVPLNFYSAPKAVGGPLLEVADFVMHCAGSAVRDRLRGRDHRKRLDVKAVFESMGHPLASYVELQSLVPHPAV